MDFIRWTVCRRSGVLATIVDGVWGGFRRKSVLMSLLGWGSEMLPKEEPLRLRAAFRRREPRMQTPAIESRIPAARPGKKPARTAVVGNLLQAGVITTGVFVEGDEDEVEVGADEGFVNLVVEDAGELAPEFDEGAAAGLGTAF